MSNVEVRYITKAGDYGTVQMSERPAVGDFLLIEHDNYIIRFRRLELSKTMADMDSMTVWVELVNIHEHVWPAKARPKPAAPEPEPEPIPGRTGRHARPVQRNRREDHGDWHPIDIQPGQHDDDSWESVLERRRRYRRPTAREQRRRVEGLDQFPFFQDDGGTWYTPEGEEATPRQIVVYEQIRDTHDPLDNCDYDQELAAMELAELHGLPYLDREGRWRHANHTFATARDSDRFNQQYAPWRRPMAR